MCESAWNKAPVLGVIGIQSGPPGLASYSFPVMGHCLVTVTISVNKLLLHRKNRSRPSRRPRDDARRTDPTISETTTRDNEQEPCQD